MPGATGGSKAEIDDPRIPPTMLVLLVGELWDGFDLGPSMLLLSRLGGQIFAL